MTVTESRLYQDFNTDHRDVLYRAMVFAAQNGGPPLQGDSLQALKANRERSLRWLESHADPAALAADYDRFVEGWSPYYRER